MQLRRSIPWFFVTFAALTFATDFDRPAFAHDDGSAAHAAEDLAGTPVSVIEQETAVSAAKIKASTGLVPGIATPAKAAADGIAPVATSTDPGVVGQWSPVTDTEVVPVFQAVLPDGKVLMWDSVGDNATESYPDQSFTRAMVWNPVDNSYKRVDVQGANIFCAGFTHLSNGNVLVAGGNANQQLAGLIQTHVFDWKTETWTRGADMAAGRWYPSVTETANGEDTIVGGGPLTSEVYQLNGAVRPLTGFTNSGGYAGRAYPFMISRPDTQLGLFGPYSVGYTLNTAGTGKVIASEIRDGMMRDYGSFATFNVGESLVVGGGNVTEGGNTNVPTKTAVIVNASNTNAAAATITPTGSMSVGRRQFNTTVLADGTVLATGGETSAATSLLVDLTHAATAAERWDPATGQWTLLASAQRVRQYHSTATLLPDGRVLTGGGGICGACVTAGYLEKNIEYFTPPYLYNHDGSGSLATRPTISGAPLSVGINAPFSFTFGQATSIAKVALVKLGDATHGVDQGQRYIPLRFSAVGNTITAQGPATGGVAPPGYYMLFVTSNTGTPSVASILQVSRGPSPIASPVKNFTGRCIDSPSAANKARTYLWVHDCNGTNAQALTTLPSDNSLRVLGTCLDVPGRKFVVGQKIWLYPCNSSLAQKWQLKPDGEIQPMAAPALCLSPTTSANKAALILTACKATTLQRWTW